MQMTEEIPKRIKFSSGLEILLNLQFIQLCIDACFRAVKYFIKVVLY